MSNTKKNGLHGKSSTNGYNFGGIGTNKTSFAEIGIIAPNGNTDATPGVAEPIYSQFEGLSYPRAIVDRMCMYNADFNIA